MCDIGKVVGSGILKLMNQKGNVLLIVLLIVAAIGGYLLYSGKITLPQKTSQQATSVNETTNWKTHTNTIVGYSFKYPDNLYVLDIELSTIRFFRNENEISPASLCLKQFVAETGYCSSGELDNNVILIGIEKFGREKYKTFEERKEGKDGAIWGLSNYKDSQGRDWVINGPATGQTAVIEGEIAINDIYYVIDSVAGQGFYQTGKSFDAEKELELLFKQILSTFKFTK